MDGVLADFVGGVLSLFSYDSAQQQNILANWPAGEYDICKVIPIGPNELWKVIDSCPDFWPNLFPLMDGLSLFQDLQNCGEVYISTSPSRHPSCAAGKVAWMQNHIKHNFRRYMLGCDKFVLAKPHSVLIDDHDDNCIDFKRSGGAAILWPQPWNSAAHLLQKENFSRSAYALEQLRLMGYVR